MTCPVQTLNKLWQCVRCMKYTVILEPGEDGYTIVNVPALPGCITQGRTREEALKNAREAIEAYVGILEKHNEPIPDDVNVEVIIDA